MLLRLAAARSFSRFAASPKQQQLHRANTQLWANPSRSPISNVQRARMSSTTYKAPSPEAIAGCQAAVYEWAESFDNKDWERLRQNIAPTLYVDYRSVMGKMWESMPRDEFVGLVTNPHFIGNTRIKTQHFVGASKWVYTSDTEVTGYHQMRVAHQKYKDDEMKEVLYKGHAHGRVTINYRLVDGVWRFAGLTPDIRWSEHDYDKIFGPDE